MYADGHSALQLLTFYAMSKVLSRFEMNELSTDLHLYWIFTFILKLRNLKVEIKEIL